MSDRCFAIFVQWKTSWVEFWWEKSFRYGWQVASVSLLEIFWVNEFLYRGLIIIAKDHKFSICKVIYESMSKLPQLTHNECDISRKEAEQTAAIILGHILNEWLDAVFGDLCHPDILEVENSSP